MSRLNIVKRIKSDGRWKMLSIPRNPKGNYDWNSLPEGRYYVEWYVGGTRRREGAGVTAAQAVEAQRHKRHELEGRKLGVPGFENVQEWMGHKSLETTMRYLVPATDVHGKLDQVTIPKSPQKSDTARKSPARETRPRRGRPARAGTS